MSELQFLLAQAEARCLSRGARFTPIRRRVLELIAASGGGLKAYDLLDQLSAEHAATRPPTIYRALAFLTRQGLVHRIESQNAYVACACPEHVHGFQLLICRICSHVEEIHFDDISQQLAERASRAGFRVERQTIELIGLCTRCQTSSDTPSPHLE